MSGLVGWVDFRRDLRLERETLGGMTGSLSQRGPDGEGVWVSECAALGHRRLRRSGERADVQPLLVETSGAPVVIAHAGAIDDAAELRSELESHGVVFRSHDEAEVVLQAYLRWGVEAVERLRGMFAFAIWDARHQRLLLGRDRLGVKPLYYHELAGGILFGSEPKAILHNRRFSARLALSAIPIVLQPRLARRGETPLSGMHELPPAHVGVYSEQGLSLRRYWRLTSVPHRESFTETAAHVRGLLEDIVRRQARGGAERSAMLSGGLDSTSVAALAARSVRAADSEARLNTFCLSFEDDPAHFTPSELRPELDAPYAAKAAAFIGTRHQTITAKVGELLEVIPQTRSARDLPAWGQFDASMYLLFREMRRHCVTALTGEAADEIFGGYPHFFKPEVVSKPRFPWLGDGPKLADCLSREVKARVDPLEDERARYAELIAEVPKLTSEQPLEARMREVLYLGMAGPLAVILDRKDRMSSAVGLEIRVPFCDHELVEYVWNVPWTMKSQGGVKGLLKAAMHDVLPPGTLNRKKSAYPHVQNPKYDRQLLAEARRVADAPCSGTAALFDRAALRDLIARAGGAGLSDKSFPGGANPVYTLIHLVELDHWISDYHVSIQ